MRLFGTERRQTMKPTKLAALPATALGVDLGLAAYSGQSGPRPRRGHLHRIARATRWQPAEAGQADTHKTTPPQLGEEIGSRRLLAIAPRRGTVANGSEQNRHTGEAQ